MCNPTTISEADYLKSRLDDQIDWYGKKSAWNRWWFHRLQLIQIVLAALIPLLSAAPDSSYLGSPKYFVAVIGVVLAIVTGVLALYRFQENWTDYRSTVEMLKHERFAFLARIEPYKDETRFQTLVERVEGLISRQHAQWENRIKTQGTTTSNRNTDPPDHK